MTTQPATTGRGAWTRRGFPINPGATQGFTNTYRRHSTAPTTGSQSSLGLDYEAVHHGVRAIQDLLNILVDGLFGPKTEAAVKAFQAVSAPPSDGIVGTVTMKALLEPTLAAMSNQYKIPDKLLHGLVRQESNRDPGAVGYTTPSDRGLVQINLAAHTNITMQQASIPSFALDWAGNRMRTQHDRYRARTDYVTSHDGQDRLAWDCAVAYHNAPAWAEQWARTGTPPNERIANYVKSVRTLGAA